MPCVGHGGIERVFFVLANSLCDEFEISLCAHAMLDRKLGTNLNSKVRLIAEERGELYLKHVNLPRQLKEFFCIAQRVKPDLIVSAYPSVNMITGLARIPLFFQGRPKWISCEHGDPNLYLGRYRIRRALKYVLLKVAVTGADAYVAVSGHVAEASERIYKGTRFRVLPNPVFDPSEIRRLSMERLEHQWYFKSEIPVIVSVGRLTKGKDFPVLLRAFKKVLAVTPARMIILGDGPEKGKLEALAKSLGLETWVLFPGYVANPYQYLSQSTVFALTSRSEGQPLAVIEAMALGIPVVVSAFPGADEFVQNNRTGFIVPVGSSEEMAKGILEVLGNALLRTEFRKNALCMARRFTITASVCAYRRLFDEVLEDSVGKSVMSTEIDIEDA
jgi:glycosyltransferase involved in cell wall biosynthesis